MNKTTKTLKSLCDARNAELIDRGNGHYQIKGKLLVNYYPASRKRSAYVAGTTTKTTGVTPEQAVDMAFIAPDLPIKNTRQSNYGARKLIMLKKSDRCHWCGKKLTINTATLEHIIPLSRGGLDNANNWALACKKCNNERGSDMPELEKQS